MSDRPLKVFISSTSEDLQEHRQAVADVIRRAGEYDIDMKYFGSRPDDPVTVCREAIEEADVLVGIYAWRYGWIPHGETRSITEMEFDYARSLGKDCLCYIIDEEHPWHPKFIEKGESENKLADFKKKVGELVRDTFNTPDNLAMKVSSALTTIIKKRERSEAGKQAPAQTRKKTGQSIPEKFPLTCNRVEQNDHFLPIFYGEEAPPPHLFFYLYGDARQAHKSLAMRFGYEIAGRYFDWETNPYQEADRTTKKWTMRRVKPEVSYNLTVYKIHLYRDLYEKFGLDMGPVPSLRVTDLYKSPALQHFTAKDTVVVIITLDEKNWHPEHTPAVVLHFVTEFCQCECPPGAPRILFFFGIEYEKEKTTVREQVKKAIDQSQYGIRLPELEPVTESNVEEWFSREDKLIEEGKDAKYMREFHFGDFGKKDMAEVEIILKKITDEFNKNEC